MDAFRVAVIAIITYCILGMSPLLEGGHFVLPVGLFKPSFFVILVIGLIVQKKKPELQEWTALLWTALLLLNSKFIFDIFIDGRLSGSGIDAYLSFHSLSNLIAYLLLLFWMLLIAWKQKSFWSIIQAIGGVLFFSGLLLSKFYILAPAIGIWYAGILGGKKTTPVHKGLGVFLVFVVLVVTIMAYLYGTNEVLIQL